MARAASNSSAQGWAAAAINKDQNVLAMGDFTFLMPPYDTVADNATLIGHLADFFAAAEDADHVIAL